MLFYRGPDENIELSKYLSLSNLLDECNDERLSTSDIEYIFKHNILDTFRCCSFYPDRGKVYYLKIIFKAPENLEFFFWLAFKDKKSYRCKTIQFDIRIEIENNYSYNHVLIDSEKEFYFDCKRRDIENSLKEVLNYFKDFVEIDSILKSRGAYILHDNSYGLII